MKYIHQTNIHLKKEVIMSYFFTKTCRKCSPVLIFMLFFQSVTAQMDFNSVNTILTKNGKNLGKDYVMVVNKAGKNIFLKESEDFKLKTPAPIASCSKWLTAALVMIYVDEGKINLDDPVSKYIPVFEKYMKGYITIRNCLSHTTGIEGEGAGILKLAQKSKFSSLEEEVNYFAAKRLIVDNPGTNFAYSGVGLNIAGRVLEVVGKKTFDRIAQEKLFKPLAMKTSSFYNDNGAINPSGGAVSSAFDYVNFLQMILNKGMFNGKRVLSENSIAEISKNQYPEAKTRYIPEVAKGFQYGMGNWIQEENEKGEGFVFSSPGLFGTWPWIDTKRNYVGIIVVKTILTANKREFYLDLKETVDSIVE